MKKTKVQLQELKLVGITCRTNNKHIFEANPTTNKIAATVQKYFHNNLHEKILNRKRPGTTYCVYTEYESDFTGNYTYFIGEEVTNFENIGEDFKTLIVPIQNYAVFTNGPGPMPDVCINAWKEIWEMSFKDFNGERAYIADFEIYDERSKDHNNVTFDIYIGIRN